ncbi:MAG: O-antigen ligase family protein [Verrucomicrobiota bacterium]|nr:O-antigen ligase family protein [Verrucomicrobiota bacterium]
MRNSENDLQKRNSRTLPATDWARNGVIALLPVLACFLGGGTEKWAEGIIVALLGLYLVARPPHLSLGATTNGIFVTLLALALVAFLPARWFFIPLWRSAVADDFAIHLSSTVSPQPWITASAFISLLAGICWLYTVSTQQLELRSVRFQLRLFVTGIVFLAAIAIALYLTHAAFPFWINQRGFGPFPNRNQTGNLFGLTSIALLACGQDDLRHGRKRWLLWLAGLGVLIAAIILNFSRAGIGILVGGSALWIGIVAFRQRSTARVALGFSFLLLLLSAILLLGGETLDRFHLHGLRGTGISTDFRWKIFRDTFDLIRASPWCGIGLGNFDPVIAIFRQASLTEDSRVLHPESDWLWIWSELGWPAVVLTIIGATLLIRRVLPLQEGTNQRFRLAALIGGFIFAVHGFVDVSGHRVGTAFAGIFLLGLSLHRPLALKESRWIAMIFRLLGLVLLVAGASWTIAARTTALLPGSVGVSNVKELATAANRGRDFAGAIALTTRALEWAPLDWQLYFSRALGEVGAKQWAGAVDDFRRARFLEPNAFEVPLTEGTVWLLSHPILAATAWREALRRAGSRRREVYSDMLNSASVKNPEVGRILEEVGLKQPDLAIAYLGRAKGEPFNHGVAELLQRDPNLQALSETEKLALFTLWPERGDLEQLSRIVHEHPDWLRYAWLGMAKYDASKNNFRGAYELTQRFGDAVAMPRVSGGATLEELAQRYYTNPDNYSAGYALYREQMQRGRVDDALLIARHFSERANAPAYFHFLEAQGWAAKQNWERAWRAWLSYRDAAAKK